MRMKTKEEIIMEKINLELCELNDYLSVDADDRFDDSCNGEFGYRVF